MIHLFFSSRFAGVALLVACALSTALWGTDHWSFRPVVDAPLPAVRDVSWSQSPLDHFILEKLEGSGLHPAPRAGRRTLIRRLTLDLTGLPPTPSEIHAFLDDESPDSFSRVLDRLLASPRYGERWGRHWLDVARYADSNGLDENMAYGTAWRYRDYVVGSFNRDKPYDQFLFEQLAGDLLEASDELAVQFERLTATGFLSIGPKVLAEPDPQKFEMDVLDEQIDTVGRALLGLTLGCARCHDHKFDPISTEEYYALAGIFQSTRTMKSFSRMSSWNEHYLASAEEVAHKEKHDEKIAAVKKKIMEVEAREKDADKDTGNDAEEGKDPDNGELEDLRAELKRLQESRPVLAMAIGVRDGKVVDAAVRLRGDPINLGDIVPRKFPAVLVTRESPAFDASQSGRLQLVRWLVGEDHPLTSRVMANRLWRWLFGSGLVLTPDNFGHLGKPPVHGALLDWLATRFIEGDWSIKRFHRLLVLSSTYQMTSTHDATAAAVDPENQLLWRMNLRRLEAESIRDSLLAVSGLIDLRMGGDLLGLESRQYLFTHTSKDVARYESMRRSVYVPIIRNHLYDVFHLFDHPDPAVTTGNRATTTVPSQALFLMNSELVSNASANMATRVLGEAGLNDGERVGRAYLLAYGRPPTDREIVRALRFMEPSAGPAEASVKAWALFCQVLLAANEFVYVR